MNEERIGHYRLEHKLGQGTYGVVYRGVHIEDPALKVAVKLLQCLIARWVILSPLTGNYAGMPVKLMVLPKAG